MPGLRGVDLGRGGRVATVVLLAALTLGVGLGGSGRLTYHEAFVAEAGREMIQSGDALVPTVGGQPWLEKPPLSVWLVAALGRVSGGVGETVARLPSALAALFLALAVLAIASRHFGPTVGLLAASAQLTTVWTVNRGRLADADVLLACLVAWTVVAFDRLRDAPPEKESEPAASRSPLTAWRALFFLGLGATSLAKGLGFGAVLVLSALALVVLWDRDWRTVRRLKSGRGWALAAAVALAWPVLAAWRHPSALGLWFFHVSDRLAAHPEQFTGQPFRAFALTLLGQLLPWAPLALAGAARSVPKAFRPSGRGGADRLLLAWTVAPLALLSMATVKNAHYAIHALPPCSVWAALALTRLGVRLRARGLDPLRVRRLAWSLFGGLGLAYALGFALLGPWLDRRGAEWAFYERAGLQVRPGEPVALLYQVPEWDRLPYPTPFGPVPHDWAVRLFYLRRDRPAPCVFGVDDLTRLVRATPCPTLAVIARPTDLPALARLGQVETLAASPSLRPDRAYRLYRLTPTPELADRTAPATRAR